MLWPSRTCAPSGDLPTHPPTHSCPRPLAPPWHPTLQSAAKRDKVSGGGKGLVRHSGKQHLNEKLSRKKIRQLRCLGAGWVEEG